MQYSPKLKTVMEQIRTILNENDIAGFVVLHTPLFSEYLAHLTPSYSGAVVTSKGVQIKINSNEIGYEKAKKIGEDTINMIHHLGHHAKESTEFFLKIESEIKKQVEVIYTSGSHTSHNQQNN